MRTPFFGPYSVSRSTNFADNNLVNLYPELIEGQGSGKDRGILYLVPGLQLAVSVGLGPVWGARVLNNVLYVVSGTDLYAVTPGLSVSHIGSVGATGPATMVDNGVQLGIWAPNLWVYTPGSGTLVRPSLPFTPAGSAVEIDGFILANQTAVPFVSGAIIWQSSLLDMTAWNALNFGSATGNSEPIVALFEMNREIYVFKQSVTEVWVNAGTGNFSFQRLEGVYIEVGCAAPSSIAQLGDTILFANRNSQGQGEILQIRAYTPQKVSTHPIEIVLQGYPTLSDLVSYAYQQDGHSFYVLSSPSGDATWVYDSTTSVRAKEPMWHRRASFSKGGFHRHPGQVQVNFAGQVLIGDSVNGNLYTYVPGLALDNGAQRKWLRSWRALPQPSDDPVRFNSLRIDMQTGINVPDGSDPLMMLRYSDDGGHNWSRERFAHAGKPGRTAHRVMFRRLGSTRRNSGLDRIFELSSTDVFPASIVGAVLE